MKKYISLILALLVIACLIPYLAIAGGDPPAPDAPAADVADPPAIADASPMIVYTAGADPPAVDLTPLLQAVVSLAVSLITAFLIPWIKAKYTAEQRQRIAAVYQTLVYAAEQMYGAGTGAKKFQWVVDQLEARGLTVDRATLEAEVRKMQNFGQLIVESEAVVDN